VVVLLTGASGFIGEHLAPALRAAGHRVIAAVHGEHAGADAVAVDYTRDFDPSVWKPRLDGVDAVINAVGILRERGAATFDALHVRTPRALFAAAAELGVHRVVQFSALGADDEAQSLYHSSKRRADDFLSSLPLSSVVVQPSLVYGVGGTSAALFDTLASLPLIPLPAGGLQRVQPVHVEDVVAAVVALLGIDSWRVGRIAFVGPAPMTLREYLATLRAGMGLSAARFISVGPRLVDAAARIGDRLPTLAFDRPTLGMLRRGSTASVAGMRAVLGREPRAPWDFIRSRERAAVAARAQLNWLLPLLRVAIATLWIVSGIVSLTAYPVAASVALLGRVGIPATLAPTVLAGAAAIDIGLGIATLVARSRWLWRFQIAIIVAYTAIISVGLPEFWAHPFGPVLKNLPILAALLLLLQLEKR
jgi:uncharacterized protein YbjT (DUF2867 family)/uncharacterized membrane protein YphA (DoxX/SURF4 family)